MYVLTFGHDRVTRVWEDTGGGEAPRTSFKWTDGQSHGRIMPPKEIHVLAYAGRKSGAVEVSKS
jgi:hypothetical protein